MAIIKKQCPYCVKNKDEVSHKEEAGYRTILFSCGHSIAEKLVDAGTETTLKDGSKAYPFQIENLRHAEKAGLRVLIADEMGLGKTISALLIMKNHPEMYPVMVVCKSSLTQQWFQEIVKKTGEIPQLLLDSRDKPLSMFRIHIVSYDLLRRTSWTDEYKPRTLIIDECQHIKNPSSTRTQMVRKLATGEITKARVYTPSLETRKRIETIAKDLLSYHGLESRFKLSFESLGKSRLGICECRATKDGIIEGQITLDKQHAENDKEDDVIETILHEIAHAITPGAGHKRIWSETSLAIGGNGQAVASCDGTIEYKKAIEQDRYIIALSGTPIKNRASEYFTILNMIRPEIFPSYEGFCRQHLVVYKDAYGSGPARLRDPEGFRESTKEFIIRHERKDVLPDLPSVQRQYHFSDLGAEVEAQYCKALVEFNEAYDKGDGKVNAVNQSGDDNILAKMARLRHLTGLAKVEACVDYLVDFLDSTDRKIVIFRHHDDVAKLLTQRLEGLGLSLLHLTSQDPNKHATIEEFRLNPKKRILIASTLSAGEGLNIQFCHDAIILERQWNPANEEQCEGRFTRIWNPSWGVDPGVQYVAANYLVAVGTIDEMLAELVEKKRHMFSETMSGETSAASWSQADLMQELAEKLRASGGKRFGIK